MKGLLLLDLRFGLGGRRQLSGVISPPVLFGLHTLSLTPAASFLLPPFRIRSFCARPPSRSCPKLQSQMTEAETYTFGPYKIHQTEVFRSTPYCYAMVNLRPVVPGHVLICPKREVKRFVDLTADEVCDLWLTAKEVGGHLEDYHKASSLTFTIQDGPQAGQTVSHVHIHVLPRRSGDFTKNDDIYDEIDSKEKEMKEKLDLDKERKDRTPDEMAQEAEAYRRLFS
ncbi:bifunctional bis(5'-adenosyl)-triphosphatase/adenylylsulfatase FHIT-like [Zingiber officinale]|uniref:bifunctional bis(5'-adenosyl)-triphosphatase/adenylylsulfatase FHIT-like n=1 Tax=Zingiber officinale TaxID=94328 RepID=UPI001C4D7594|nr:bifunctional bis(5'-adenosyl)-triphosphatase/adenylylsulfatase FHIT-like [Zingiber officinale]